MKNELKLYCNHDPTKYIITGVNGYGLTRFVVNQTDTTEIRFVCSKCKLVFNSIEINHDHIIWNSIRKVGKLTRFDEKGNIIKR